MDRKRRYADGCAFAQSLDVVGDRWAMLVIRELLFAPKRFSDLAHDLPGIATNVLAQRLRDLEDGGVLRRQPVPGPGPGQVYALTDWGRDFAPVIRVMGAWGARSPVLQQGWPITATALVLSLVRLLDSDRAAGMTAAIALDLSGQGFSLTIEDGALIAEGGSTAWPDLRISATPETLARIIFGGGSLPAAEAAGALTLAGSRALAERFVGLFPLPAAAPTGPF